MTQPKIYTADDHHIRNDLIDPNALYVLRKLHEAGFIAYLVGGSVRDLLMHKKPKDYDISTSAEPQEVKNLFKRQCILVGRRFPLAHILFGREYIEVATFRAGDPEDDKLITEDSLWGTPEQDVHRRDFTINGLFYDPLDHKIIDYVEGFEDLKKHLLHSIGDPYVRFKQDPVRMIRMLKFQARFGFHVQKEALLAQEALREEITKSSPARVLEEIFRMLESGAAEPFFRILYRSKFLHTLLPKLTEYIDLDQEERFFAYLKSVDALNTQGTYRTLFREILAAAILFPIVEMELEKSFKNQGNFPSMGKILETIDNLIQELFVDSFTHFPKRLRFGAYYITEMQYRLTPLDKRKTPPKRLAKQKNFLQPLLFLKLRSLMDPDLFRSYEYWKRVWKEGDEAPIDAARDSHPQ